MFGLVSKKKYRELEEKYRELSDELSSKRWKYYEDMGQETRTTYQLTEAIKMNLNLQAELQKYKQKYADELQKRLELAERVKELEEGAGKDAESKVHTNAAGTGGAAQG